MKIEELLLNFVNQEYEPRKLGRYWASDIYAIKKGYLNENNFFSERKINIDGARMIVVGMAIEKIFYEILEKNKIKNEYDKKYELEINDDIMLVVKPDFEFENYVLEMKFPFRSVDGIPEKWVYQLEVEHQATGKDVYLAIAEVPFHLRFIRYEPSRDRWNDIKKTLIDFHSRLKKQKNVL